MPGAPGAPGVVQSVSSDFDLSGTGELELAHDFAEFVNFTGAGSMALVGRTLNAYVPPLEVSGADFYGPPLDFSNVHHLDFGGNAFLSAAGLRVQELGVLNTLSSSLTIASVPADGQWLYVEYNAPGNFPPDGSTLAAPLESIGDCYLYAAPIGTAAAAPFTLTSSGETDCFAQIVAGPSTVAGHWSGTLASGTGPSTINLTTGVGRLYVFIADRYNNVSSSVASGVTSYRHIDTTFTTPMTSGTEPNATAVTFGMDVVAAGTTVLTVTPGSPGFSSSACYIAVLLAPPAGPVDSVTVTVPPTSLISAGTVISSDLLTLVTGAGVTATGSGNTATLANSGVLSVTQDGTLQTGAVTLTGGGIVIEDGLGHTIANPATLVLSGGTLSGNSTLATYTMPSGGGGGSGGDSVSFVQVYTYSRVGSFEVPMDLSAYDYEMVCRITSMASAGKLYMQLGYGTPGSGTYYTNNYGTSWGSAAQQQEPGDYYVIDNSNINSGRLARVRISADAGMAGSGAQVEYAAYYSQNGGVFSCGGPSVVTLAQFVCDGFLIMSGTVTVYRYPRS
jgi:hypothetical protein